MIKVEILLGEKSWERVMPAVPRAGELVSVIDAEGQLFEGYVDDVCWCVKTMEPWGEYIPVVQLYQER